MAAPFASQPGYSETPAEPIWEACIEAVRDVCSQRRGTEIQSIGVTSQRASVVALDDQGVPLRPVILWSDQRRCAPPDSLGLTGLGMRLIGVLDTARRFQADAEINYLASEEPELWAKVNKLLFISGYLNFRLTGQYKDSTSNQVGYIPFDYRRQTWASKRMWHWKALPAMRMSHLPELVSAGSMLGQLSATAAQELGLSQGLPVVACATDKACEVLGTGCTDITQASLSFGTAATVNVTSPTYREIERFVPAYPAAIPGQFLCEQHTYRGFWLVNWFKREFAQAEQALAATKGVPAESLFDDFLRDTSPGAEGLFAQPYWSPGVRVPGPEARGALLGFNATHTKAHVYRALIEGLVYSMRENLEKITRRTRQPVSLIRAAGGGSQSDEVLQIAANVLGQPVERVHTYEASSLGAAICSTVATGAHTSFASAVTAMSHAGKRFFPQSKTAQQYDELYTKVYKRIYSQMQPLYVSIARLQQHTRDL